ncbi:MAG: tRNA epoxyqueuosine(34) reductase QueG [Lentisphaerae bacterium]|nr:tRNA epoxyqueuosine(34) reductase QueG [Lentisphaerota bacterium]
MITQDPSPAQQTAAPPGPPWTQESLRALAAGHGFDDVRVTSAAPHPEAGRIFRAWIERERHGEMRWLESDPDRRATPQHHISDARAILTLAVNHYRVAAPLVAGEGRVARYAAGEDYHRVLDRGMQAMIVDLQRSDPHGMYRYYVDYGPVLERAFAERAGLGFIGRSANLIHPRFGTYVFLATIITNAPLPLTPRSPGTCGQCRRCLEVCPTGALTSPYEIDARLCISYLTIENRGPIPRHLRPLIGHWLFGCDLCQEVCPYNARLPEGQHPRLARSRIAGTALDIPSILSIRTARDFSARFSRSPLRRAKREGLLRNAAVVAGNLRQAPLVPALVQALQDASPLVRGHVVWALAQCGEVAALRAHRERETDLFVISELDAVGG